MTDPVARIGQPVIVHLVLSNGSKSKFALRENWWEDLDYELKLSDNEGKEVAFTEYGKKLRTGPIHSSGGNVVLKPDEKIEFDADISRIYDVSVPGDYTLQACRTILAWGNIYSDKLTVPFTH